MSASLPVRISFGALGGNLVDANPQTIDPSTDRTADQINSAFATIAAVAAVSPNLVIAFSIVGGVLTVTSSLAAFAGVSVVAAHPSTGVCTFTFPASVTDLAGNVQTLSPVAMTATITGSGTAKIATTSLAQSGSNWVVTVSMFSTAGAATDAPSATLVVF